MYFLDNRGVPQDVLGTTFADLNMVEADVEEMLRKNIRLVCDEKVKDKEARARLLANGHVRPLPEDAVELSLQQWLRGVLKWSSVQTYTFSIHEKSGKSLGSLREEWMETLER